MFGEVEKETEDLKIEQQSKERESYHKRVCISSRNILGKLVLDRLINDKN